MSVKPKCPKCENELDVKNDIKWENTEGLLKSIAVFYCGMCGAILSVGGSAKLFSNKGH